jgi:hypothetical protein
VNNELPEEKNIANKILEIDHESRLDFGKTQETIGRDSSLETVGEDDRPEDG